MQTYAEAMDFLLRQLPMFTRDGAQAIQFGLDNIQKLCNHLQNPQQRFPSVHVAGTNGKGSTSHLLASILQEAGYKVGLYTSPHLKNFTERIRINGIEISQNEVLNFILEHETHIREVQPSFFEITAAMAFDYFAQQEVDIAIIEVGLGGRLDATNIIHPILSIITNISYDHTDLLGNTLAKIAKEKAGIIKDNVPVVVSEYQHEVQSVFEEIATLHHSRLLTTEHLSVVFKQSQPHFQEFDISNKVSGECFILQSALLGSYQSKNLKGVLVAIYLLQDLGWNIQQQHILDGCRMVIKNTHLLGRWQQLGVNPMIIADTAHNEAGIKEVLMQIQSHTFSQLWMVLGMVKDKDIDKILSLLPKKGNYIFCQANIPRALDAKELHIKAQNHQLTGEVVPKVQDAFEYAKKHAHSDDLIYIGGSTFVVAELRDL